MPYTPGPFSAVHLYLQWGGKLPGGESWSNGMRFINKGGGAAGDEAAMLAGAGAAVAAFHARSATGISPLAKLSFVKLNAIGTDGLYIADSTTEATYADVAGGNSFGTNPPNQICIAASLTTGFSRGVAHRGRFYIPLPVYTPDATGLIGSTEATQTHGSVTTLLANLNAVSTHWEIGVMSRKLGSPGARRVTGVEVGRVLDTQRRRRRSLPETYA